jgi:hypothetical protein
VRAVVDSRLSRNREDAVSSSKRGPDLSGGLNSEHGSSDIVRNVNCVPYLMLCAGIRSPGPLQRTTGQVSSWQYHYERRGAR